MNKSKEIQSILNSVKKKIGGSETYDIAFDHDIIVSINSAFATLHQLGIDGKDGKQIRIEDDKTTWDDVIDTTNYEWLKDYVYLHVRLVFDPPTSSFVLDSMKSQLDEMTWRIEVEKDNEIMDNV